MQQTFQAIIHFFETTYLLLDHDLCSVRLCCKKWVERRDIILSCPWLHELSISAKYGPTELIDSIRNKQTF